MKEEGNEKEIPEIPVTKGEAVVDVGDFTVTVPEGWLGAGELSKDDNGEYFMEPDYYVVIKGGESAEDAGIKPTVSMFYTTRMDAQTLHDDNLISSDENTELDITVGGKKCPAYHTVMDLSEEGEDEFVMEYDYIFIPVSDSSCVRITMQTFSTDKGDTGVSASDKDVIAIMESLKVN